MTGYQRVMMWLTISCGLLSVLLGIGVAYLLHDHAYSPIDIAIGVACATAGTQILQNLAQLVLVRRRLGIWTMIHFSPMELYRYLRPNGEGGGTAAEDAAGRAAEALVGPDDPQDDDPSNGQTSRP